MLASLLRNDNGFEKGLEVYLASKGESIDELQLQKLMRVLKGEDSETKSEIAFASLRARLRGYYEAPEETTLLKLLIFFDKLVEEGLYCDQIAKMSFLALQLPRQNFQKPLSTSSLQLLKAYWKLVRERGSLIAGQDHIYREKRSQRKHFLDRARPALVLKQVQSLESFFNSNFQLSALIESAGQKQSQLRQYVLQHILYKLLGLYNCSMMAVRWLSARIQQLRSSQVSSLRRVVGKFRENCNRLASFMRLNSSAPGFQTVHCEEIRVEVCQKLMRCIDDYTLLDNQSSQSSLISIPLLLGKILVEKKPHSFLKGGANPRLSLPGQTRENEGNSFANWHNAFSFQFPQKQVMTIDLILQLKQQEQEEDPSSTSSYYQSRCSYDSRSTNVSSHFQLSLYSPSKKLPLPASLFSTFQEKWNSP